MAISKETYMKRKQELQKDIDYHKKNKNKDMEAHKRQELYRMESKGFASEKKQTGDVQWVNVPKGKQKEANAANKKGAELQKKMNAEPMRAPALKDLREYGRILKQFDAGVSKILASGIAQARPDAQKKLYTPTKAQQLLNETEKAKKVDSKLNQKENRQVLAANKQAIKALPDKVQEAKRYPKPMSNGQYKIKEAGGQNIREVKEREAREWIAKTKGIGGKANMIKSLEAGIKKMKGKDGSDAKQAFDSFVTAATSDSLAERLLERLKQSKAGKFI